MLHRLPTKCPGRLPAVPVPGTQLSTLRLVPAPADMHPYRMPSYALIGDNANGHDAKTMPIYNMGLMSLGSWREIISLVYFQPHFSKHP